MKKTFLPNLTLMIMAGLLGAMTIFAPQVMAAEIVVNSILDTTGDAGICTLRDAITSADTDTATGGCAAGSGDDTVTFDAGLSGQTITLGSNLPQLTTIITIDGEALASHVQISGYMLSSDIVSGATVILNHLNIIDGTGFRNRGTLTVSSSTFSGNRSGRYGGAITNLGTLTVTSSTFSDNSSGENGGVIYNRGNVAGGAGMATVRDSTFSENSTAKHGGVIYNYFGTLTVSNSTFSGNSAGSQGGTIYNLNSTVTVSNSTFSGNSAVREGGGISDRSGTLTVSNSTFSGNSTTATYGGGIYAGGTATVSNSTFSGNSAATYGGGIANSGILTVSNSTFSGNSAATGGGNIHNYSGYTLTLTNTILADNAGGGDCFNDGTISSAVGNLIEDAASACGLTHGTDGNIIGIDPMLSALADNEGPTLTMALQAGSPAIDAGNATACEATDQRGVERDAACDIGAYECDGISVSSVSAPADGSYKAGDTVSITVTFSEDVTVTGAPQLTLDTGGTAVFDSVSGDTLTFTHTVADGHNSDDLDYAAADSLDLNGGTIKNTGGDDADLTLPEPGEADSLSDSNDIVIDTAAPGVTLSTTASDPTNTSPFGITITFDEEVTGFGPGDISVGNGTAGGFSNTTAGKVWTADITPSSDGEVTVDISAGAAQDAAGNDNTAATTLSRTYDGTKPMVTVEQTADPVNSPPVNFTVVFSEAVSDFATGDVTLGGTASGTLSGTVTGSGTTYNVAVTGMTSAGTVTAEIGAGKATDSVGNGNAAATSTDNEVTFT
ncbi:MAG: hypothetical protein DRI57_29880, partial [Deltaproteobacteria bacterium]